LRREGRRKRKAGAKNEKAIFIIQLYSVRSRKKSRKMTRKLQEKYRVTIPLFSL